MKLDEIVAKIKQIKTEEMDSKELIVWSNKMQNAHAQIMRTADELDHYNLSGEPTKQVEICDEVHEAMFTIFCCLQDQARYYIETWSALDYEIYKRLRTQDKR